MSASPERAFLHQIANEIAGAKTSLEVLVEVLNVPPGSDAHQLLTAAIDSLGKATLSVEKRRAEIIAAAAG